MTADRTGFAELREIARRAMGARGFEPDFSPAAREQAQKASPQVTSAPGARDLSALPWVSIDNDDSRDLDQLSVGEPLSAAEVRLRVAIADVDGLVGVGSPIDAHARTNTTSVYTAAEVFPMLPERLSTDLTSLGEDALRPSLVYEMTIGPDGAIRHADVYRALVRNCAKLAYASIGAWLEGHGAAPARLAAVTGLDEQLRLQDRVAQSLKRARHAQGALTLATDQAQAIFDQGVLTDLRPDTHNRASELIEELMVAANGVAARYLEQHGMPSLRRILRTPERWDRIVALAASLGTRLPSVPDGVALNTFLAQRRAADPQHFGDLSLSVVKLLGRGEYMLQRPGQTADGHFGLAVRDYVHATAPNRRFPDLITLRLIKAALAARAAPYADAELAQLAEHCTQQEANARKVERQVGKSAAALLLAAHIGDEFDALVTGASASATWVRIAQPATEGLLVQGAAGLDVGDHVRVRLVHTDVARGFIDFARAG